MMKSKERYFSIICPGALKYAYLNINGRLQPNDGAQNVRFDIAIFAAIIDCARASWRSIEIQ